MWYLTPKPKAPLSGRYNIRLLFYMPTRRKVDKTNLESAIMDVLVDAKILADDNRNAQMVDIERIFCVAHFDVAKKCKGINPSEEQCIACRYRFWNEEVTDND